MCEIELYFVEQTNFIFLSVARREFYEIALRVAV